MKKNIVGMEQAPSLRNRLPLKGKACGLGVLHPLTTKNRATYSCPYSRFNNIYTRSGVHCTPVFVFCRFTSAVNNALFLLTD